MTSSSDWWGAPSGGTPLMGLADLDLESRTNDLDQRQQELRRESDDLDERTARTTEVVTEGFGEGTAERGAVTVRVDAQHRLTDLQLTPKAMHLGSTERLREAVLDAYDAACQDMARQFSEATGLQGPFSPLDAFIAAIPEVAAVLPGSLRQPPPRERPEAVTAEPDEDEELVP